MLSIFTQKVVGAIAFLSYLFNTIFWLIPILILSFLKTLLPFITTQKALSQLLKPKAGGIALALDAMNGQLDTLVDVTIYYPQGIPTFWRSKDQKLVQLKQAKIND